MRLISVWDLLEIEIAKKTRHSGHIKACITAGVPIDDEIVCPIVEKELRRTDS